MLKKPNRVQNIGGYILVWDKSTNILTKKHHIFLKTTEFDQKLLSFLFCVCGRWNLSCFSNTMFFFYCTPNSPPNFIVYLCNVHIIFRYLKECYAWRILQKFLNANNKENYYLIFQTEGQVIFPEVAFQMKAVLVVHWSCFHWSWS